MRRGVLQLEKDITIRDITKSSNTYALLLSVGHGALIMKDGSAVKGWVGDGSSNVTAPIYLFPGDATPFPRFIMDGGEISGCTKTGMVVNFAAVAHVSGSKNRFIKTGGRIINNTANDGTTPKNIVLFGTSYTNNAANNNFTIEDNGTNYFLPLIGN
jgi:hypothetical protein